MGSGLESSSVVPSVVGTSVQSSSVVPSVVGTSVQSSSVVPSVVGSSLESSSVVPSHHLLSRAIVCCPERCDLTGALDMTCDVRAPMVVGRRAARHRQSHL